MFTKLVLNGGGELRAEDRLRIAEILVELFTSEWEKKVPAKYLVNRVAFKAVNTDFAAASLSVLIANQGAVTSRYLLISVARRIASSNAARKVRHSIVQRQFENQIQ